MESRWVGHLTVRQPDPEIVFKKTPKPENFPEPPVNLSHVSVTQNSVHLTWKDNHFGTSVVIGHRIEYFSIEDGEVKFFEIFYLVNTLFYTINYVIRFVSTLKS